MEAASHPAPHAAALPSSSTNSGNRFPASASAQGPGATMTPGPPPRQDDGGCGDTGNCTFALPPELIVLIARQCRHRSLTALHLVSRRTHEVLDVPSLWCGAAVDRAGERAALAWAVGRRCGNTAVLRLLARLPDCDLKLAFRTAALRGHEAAAAVLLMRGALVPPDALEIAAARGYLGTLRLIYEFSFSGRSKSAVRALHAAAREGHVDVVEFLLDRNVCASLALQAACTAGQAAVVHAILERGPGLLPKFGLETAVSLGHAEVVKEFLLERVWDGPGTPARFLEAQPSILALAVREVMSNYARNLGRFPAESSFLTAPIAGAI
ncbi:MAG: hypothetical protein BJ554DRAFT_3102 [Olpidium bornovanus]|uniref:Uncharacterized protein n=1 Tax=Olpidium bornovanus TaxID=278681 RepID=A0A8H7ZPS0_9FUNG|nr:MAG: hypothetical protein BJ554DRAFT_3102 [Olpidium bornovanus]